MTLTKRFETWAFQYEQQGIEKGEARGIEKGEALLLQRLLVRRFGALPNDVVARISAASQEQLESWSDRILDATCLNDIFRA